MKEKEIMNKRNEHVINKNRIFELLRVNKIPDQIELIKDLPIIALKDLDVQTNHIIKKILGISTIKELAEVEISPEEMREIRSMGVSVSSLEKWIAASKIISDIDKIKNENKKKIVFMGLDNAGKTTIINLITGKFGLNTLMGILPTKGVDRHEIVGVESNYSIWDFGGQKLYQETYLKNPERYLMGIEVMFYVVDVQDEERYYEAVHYLKKVLEVMEYLGEVPEINILLHKFDPELEEDPKWYEKIVKLQEMIKEVIDGYQCEFYTTSIYNYVMGGKNVVKELKRYLREGEVGHVINGDMKEVIGVMEDIMDAFIKFNVSIMDTLKKIMVRMRSLEEKVYGEIVENESANDLISGIDKVISQEMLGIFSHGGDPLNSDIKEIFSKKFGTKKEK